MVMTDIFVPVPAESYSQVESDAKYLLNTTDTLTGDLTTTNDVLASNKLKAGTPTTDGVIAAKASGSAYIDVDSSTNANAGYRFWENGVFKWQIANDGDGGDALKIDSATGLRITLAQNGDFTVHGDTLNISTQKTPASAAAAGVKGDFAHDTGFLYICTATNTWKRVAIATW